jgi:hypothetical protein
MRVPLPLGLMLRSVAKQRVSKHVTAPSFETAAKQRAEDEGGAITSQHN